MIYKVSSIVRSRRNYILKLKGPKLDYKPGQFVMLKYGDIKRPYSISSAPDFDYLEFFITNVGGTFTSKLDDLYDKEIEVIGPYGNFTFDGEERAIFISSGSGISPIMSMIRSIKNSGDYHLFASFKYLDDNLYSSELKSIRNIKVNIRYTQEGDSRFSLEDFNEFKDYKAYLCGNKEFVLNFAKIFSNKKFEYW